MGKISRYFIAKLVLRSSPIGAQFGLVSHADQLLLPLGNTFESFPSFKVEKVVISCINGTGDRIICSNYAEGFRGDLPIFQFYQNIVA